jgi:hypothetical protein
MSLVVHAFYEGPTEEKVLSRLSELLGIQFDHHTPKPGQEGNDRTGKGKLVSKVLNIVTPLLNEEDVVRVLIMRDVDSGERLDSVLDGLQTNLSGRFDNLTFQSPPGFSSIAIGNATNLKLALHLADHSCMPGCSKTTMDDHILQLALLEETASRLLPANAKQVSPDRLLAKVREEIPQILVANGFHLTEAKDYVRLYSAVVQMHTSPPAFAARVLANSTRESILSQFAPLIAAIEALTS